MPSSDLGRENFGGQGGGFRMFTLQRRITNIDLTKETNQIKTFPLGFSTTADGIHNASPGTSLADPDGPYFVIGEKSDGDSEYFYPYTLSQTVQ